MIFDKKHTHRRKPLMAILQLIAEKEKSLCFDFLEEKIREESRKLIESIYADEVNQFLEKMASISNFNPQHLTTSHPRLFLR